MNVEEAKEIRCGLSNKQLEYVEWIEKETKRKARKQGASIAYKSIIK